MYRYMYFEVVPASPLICTCKYIDQIYTRLTTAAELNLTLPDLQMHDMYAYLQILQVVAKFSNQKLN